MGHHHFHCAFVYDNWPPTDPTDTLLPRMYYNFFQPLVEDARDICFFSLEYLSVVPISTLSKLDAKVRIQLFWYLLTIILSADTISILPFFFTKSNFFSGRGQFFIRFSLTVPEAHIPSPERYCSKSYDVK